MKEEELNKRREQWGENALPEVKVNKCLQLVRRANNALSWVMDSASAARCAASRAVLTWAIVPGAASGIRS